MLDIFHRGIFMKQSNKIVAGAIAMLLPVAWASAQGTPPSDSGATTALDLSPLDTDKDGLISKAEAAQEPAIAQVFAQVDANGDGFIDAKEAKRLRAPAPAPAPGQ
jgi:hypothetical protein